MALPLPPAEPRPAAPQQRKKLAWKDEERALNDVGYGADLGVCCTQRATARWFVGVMVLAQIGVVVGLAVLGKYNMTAYTFWNYTMLTAFYPILFVALFVEGRLLTIALAFLLPPILVSCTVVPIAITILIQINPELYQSDGSSVGSVHSGDMLVHVVPILSLLVVALGGVALYARTALNWLLAHWRSRGSQVLYKLYFVASALLPLFVYGAIFDPATHYPSSLPDWAEWLGMLGLVAASGLVYWFALTARIGPEHRIRLALFALEPAEEDERQRRRRRKKEEAEEEEAMVEWRTDGHGGAAPPAAAKAMRGEGSRSQQPLSSSAGRPRAAASYTASLAAAAAAAPLEL